jgi:predicted GNAT superfamily acetyltransferase
MKGKTLRVLSENELAARTSSLVLAYADVPQILWTHDEKPLLSGNKQINPKRLRKFFVIAAKLYAEMVESWSTKDANQAVVAITVILKRFGALPKVLADAYQHEIEIGDVSVTRRFYEQLAVNCPAALDYFTERVVDERESEKDRVKGSLRKIPID